MLVPRATVGEQQMSEAAIKKEFTEILRKVYTPENLRMVDKKYHSIDYMFRRFYPILRRAKALGLDYGLDFGCGCAATLVLGRLMGVYLIGADLLYQSDRALGGVGDCCYKGIQDSLRGLGYEIINFDTNQYPWAFFASDSFRFVLSYWSLAMPPGWSAGYEGRTGEGLCARWAELSRITMPGGCWFVHPTRYAEKVKASPAYRIIRHKRIRIELC